MLCLLEEAVLILHVGLVLVPAGEALGANVTPDDKAHVLRLNVALDQAYACAQGTGCT